MPPVTDRSSQRNLGATLVLESALVVLCLHAGVGAEEPRSPAALTGALTEAIDAIRARSEFATSTFGVLIRHVPTGAVLVEHHADKLFAPASTVKIITAAGALAALGPEHRFETRIVGAGVIEAGTLAGDVVLVGSGDPNLSQRVRSRDRLDFENNDHSYAGFARGKLVRGDPLVIVEKLAAGVRQAGVTRIDGDVVVDDGLFADTFDPFVGKFSAVCVNDNLVDVVVRPGKTLGGPVDLVHQPRARVIEIRSLAKTARAGSRTKLRLKPREGVASFDLVGSIAIDADPVLRVGVLPNPAITAAHYLLEALRKQGVGVSGEVKHARFGPTIYADYPVLARHTSAPLSEAVRVMLKVSQNVHATMLPVVVGAARGKRGTLSEGYRRMRSLFLRDGLDMDGVVIGSGSGGGRADRLSPRWLVDFLGHLTRRRDFDAFFAALPIGGEDGTLAGRCTHALLRGVVHAKTGTLVYRGVLNDRWVFVTKALAGYLDLRSSARPDDLWSFAIFIANTITSDRERGSRQLFRAQEDILKAARRAIAAEITRQSSGEDAAAN